MAWVAIISTSEFSKGYPALMPSRQFSRRFVPTLVRRAVVAFMLIAPGACTTVTLRPWGESPNQSIDVAATDWSGAPRTGVQCTLRNDKGEWRVTIPGQVEVARSSQPLRIECADGDGVTTSLPDVAAIDERTERATQSAKKFSVLGVAGTIAFLGAFALTPAAIAYMAVGGATVGGMAAAEQATADTVTGAGGGYPQRITLRY